MTTEELARAVDHVATTRPDLIDRLTRAAEETRAGKRIDTMAAAWSVAVDIEQADTQRRRVLIAAVLTRLVEVQMIEAGADDPPVDADLVDHYAHAIEEMTR